MSDHGVLGVDPNHLRVSIVEAGDHDPCHVQRPGSNRLRFPEYDVHESYPTLASKIRRNGVDYAFLHQCCQHCPGMENHPRYHSATKGVSAFRLYKVTKSKSPHCLHHRRTRLLQKTFPRGSVLTLDISLLVLKGTSRLSESSRRPCPRHALLEKSNSLELSL